MRRIDWALIGDTAIICGALYMVFLGTFMIVMGVNG